MSKECYIVAELGSNCWPFTREKFNRLLDAARYAGADAVKVQLFWSQHFPKAEQKEKLKYVFPRTALGWLKDAASYRGLDLGASVFDIEAVDLVSDLGLDFLKLATREQHNFYLRMYANMRYHGTIIRSVSYPPEYPVKRMPREVTLGCIPEYPTERPHWHWLHDLHTMLPVPWGWSSHTLLYEDCLIAAAKGASVIEKHIYYSDNDPEYRWSMPSTHFASMVKMVRLYEKGHELLKLQNGYNAAVSQVQRMELEWRRSTMRADEILDELERKR